jgi:hypothetical protein
MLKRWASFARSYLALCLDLGICYNVTPKVLLEFARSWTVQCLRTGASVFMRSYDLSISSAPSLDHDHEKNRASRVIRYVGNGLRVTGNRCELFHREAWQKAVLSPREKVKHV